MVLRIKSLNSNDVTDVTDLPTSIYMLTMTNDEYLPVTPGYAWLRVVTLVKIFFIFARCFGMPSLEGEVYWAASPLALPSRGGEGDVHAFTAFLGSSR